MKSIVFQVLFILALIGSRTQWVHAEEGSAAKTESSAASAPTQEESSGEYEIDYEEEPDSGGGESTSEDSEEAVAEKPAPKTSKTPQKTAEKTGKRNAYGGGPAVQGTHSKNRFAPILKSETRSVYKKNGKPLDVDTD